MSEAEYIPSSKPGPKPKFELWMCDKIKEVAEAGGHIAQMCVAIGINSENTFHEWKKKYPEFKEAYDESKTISKAVYENILLQGAMGKIPGFSFNSLAMIIHNKFSDEYKHGAKAGGGSTEITINQLNLSPEQIDYKIAQSLEKLKSAGQTIELLGFEDESK